MPITPWISFSTKDHPLRLKKEIMTIGIWKKGDQEIDFSLDFANHLVSSHYEMLEAGVRTPLVLSHKGDSAYGDLVDVMIEKNPKGKDAIFGIFDFKDEAAYNEAKRNDVSVYIPPKRLTGTGKEYLRVLEHVALTPWPVVPGLADWEAIAASLQFAQEKTTVDLEELISLLEVEVPDGASEETQWALIVNAVKALKKQVDGDPASEEDAGAGDKPPALPVAASWNPPKALVNQVRDARIIKLDALVSGECITPAVRDELAKDFATDEVVALSMKDDKADDGFDKLVARLAKNKVTPKRGAFDVDHIEMSHDGNGEKLSGLKADAKKRAEQAKARNRR